MSKGFGIVQFFAFWVRSLFWSVNMLLAFYTLLAYWLLRSLFIEHWLAGMIMISIPVVWVFNLLCSIVWLFYRPWRALLSGLVVLVGVVMLQNRTFVWHTPTVAAGPAVKLFSYNVQSFNVDSRYDDATRLPLVKDAVDYVIGYDAPIKCLQEVVNITDGPGHDFVGRMKAAGYAYSIVLFPEGTRKPNGNVGMAIYSRYPIVNSDHAHFSGDNGILWANIKVGNDTIRVINVHRHSMGIRVGKVLKQQEITGVKHETRGVLSALRQGFIMRAEQVRQVERHVMESEVPVLVTGDHNDTPYSVVYEHMRRLLHNSFEGEGRGFGFTYNRAPGFIRIDHQFHDPRLPVLNFETLNTVRYSDHYPIAGTYQLPGKRVR